MKIAIMSDIHDNELRLQEALDICHEKDITTCICSGDIQHLETLQKIANHFQKVYLAFGNGDYAIAQDTSLIPNNVDWSDKVNELALDNLKVAIVHYDYVAKTLAESNKYNIVFYGHTHTPWEKKVRRTTMINPGEVAGQYGKASFAIFDTKTETAKLHLLA